MPILLDNIDEAAKFSLNAPFGARCFLTMPILLDNIDEAVKFSLNAPFGARCFLTGAPPIPKPTA